MVAASLSAALLAGCVQLGSPATADAFSEPTFDSETDDRGYTTHEIRFTAKRSVGIAEANMFAARQGACPEGGLTQEIESLSNDHGPGDTGPLRAGTTFRMKIACAPLPNEVALPPGVTVAEARRLVMTAAGMTEAHWTSFSEVQYDRQRGKFPVFHEHLGQMLTMHGRFACNEGPVTLRRVGVGVPAVDPSFTDGRFSRLSIGLVLECTPHED